MTVFDQLTADLTPRYGHSEARSIARIVFEDAFGTKSYSEKKFNPEEATIFADIRARLLRGEPVQYVVGQAAFFGSMFRVSPAVLIPRQETEELVDWALQILKTLHSATPKILDIGTGSGCIPIILKKQWPQAELTATDISHDALEIAQENAQQHDVFVHFQANNILDREGWATLPEFDLIVSNPPYIPRSEAELMPDWVKDHEPHLALFVLDEQPLLFYETIADFALEKLRPGGALLFECNEFNAKKVHHLLFEKGFSGVELRRDLLGKPRMVGGWQSSQ
ncbi:MAG: peptide chain release factor N(5)-glutamine methyltransferase [Saprospiraceae bacterium]